MSAVSARLGWWAAAGLCSTVTFTRKTGLIVVRCTQVAEVTLRLIDPKILKDVGTCRLPPRPSVAWAGER
nr:hypothetical protein GCM10010200_043520 [Actinomadura rugatobispora]